MFAKLLKTSRTSKNQAKYHRKRRLGMEALETRQMMATHHQATINVTPAEAYILEQINRLRMHPTAELSQLLNASDVQSAINYFHVDQALLQQQWSKLAPVEPLAMNQALRNAARNQSGLLLQKGLQSGQTPHQLPGEDPFWIRDQKAGYTSSATGENIAPWASSAYDAYAAWAIDWNSAGPYTTGGMWDPAKNNGCSHRVNLMAAGEKEIGIGRSTTPPTAWDPG